MKAASSPTADLLRLEVKENGRIVLELLSDARPEPGQIMTAVALLR